MKRAAPVLIVALAAACGGGGGGGAAANGSPLVRVSAPTPFAADCGGSGQAGTLYPNAEVEPHVAANPARPGNLIGVWQQDRWSNGGAQALMTAASFDGGASWTAPAGLRTDRCAGGSAADGANYQRASDPWVTFAPDGTAYASSLSFTGGVQVAGSSNGILVVRSTDGGRSFGEPAVLIADGSDAFDDKDSITADPTDASFVYAVWDRPSTNTNGPTYAARTADGGLSWEPARAIYDPGSTSQTIGNVIAVLPDGTLLDLLTQIDTASDGSKASFLAVVRSLDHGATWSGSVRVADLEAVGVTDPQTHKPVRDGAGLGQIAVTPSGQALVVWQDARFSGGDHDGVALSRSTDGGLTWSAAVQVNGAPQAQAFTPTVAVSPDGSIAVTYYDSRDDTASGNTFLTDVWLAESSDGGATWSESQIAGPFDLDLAPDSDGLFLGDYQALAGGAAGFAPFFVQTTAAKSNRTDVFVLPEGSAGAGALSSTELRVAAPAAPLVPRADFARRVSDRLTRLVTSRRRGR